MGRLSDRYGIMLPLIGGAIALGLGYVLSAQSTNITQFAVIHGALIGFGTSAAFAPLMADISRWFIRRRGIAVALCASGNYIAGTVWPPVVQTLPRGRRLAPNIHGRWSTLCRDDAAAHPASPNAAASSSGRIGRRDITAMQGSLGITTPRTSNAAHTGRAFLLRCDVDAAGPHRRLLRRSRLWRRAPGAEMLSLSAGLRNREPGRVGLHRDRIGGLPTLLVGSMLQALTLVLYALFNGLPSLYLISALFGIGPGGHRAELCIHYPRIFAGIRSRHPRRPRHHGDAAWDGARRLDVRSNLRFHRFLPWRTFVNGVLWNVLKRADRGPAAVAAKRPRAPNWLPHGRSTLAGRSDCAFAAIKQSTLAIRSDFDPNCGVGRA